MFFFICETLFCRGKIITFLRSSFIVNNAVTFRIHYKSLNPEDDIFWRQIIPNFFTMCDGNAFVSKAHYLPLEVRFRIVPPMKVSGLQTIIFLKEEQGKAASPGFRMRGFPFILPDQNQLLNTQQRSCFVTSGGFLAMHSGGFSNGTTAICNTRFRHQKY